MTICGGTRKGARALDDPGRPQILTNDDAVRVICSALDVWRSRDAEEAAAVRWIDLFAEVAPRAAGWCEAACAS